MGFNASRALATNWPHWLFIKCEGNPTTFYPYRINFNKDGMRLSPVAGLFRRAPDLQTALDCDKYFSTWNFNNPPDNHTFLWINQWRPFNFHKTFKMENINNIWVYFFNQFFFKSIFIFEKGGYSRNLSVLWKANPPLVKILTMATLGIPRGPSLTGFRSGRSFFSEPRCISNGVGGCKLCEN